MLRSLMLLLALAVAPAAFAAPPAAPATDGPDADAVEHVVGSDRFAAGHAVSFGASTSGDAFAAGGRVTVDGAIAGDAFLTGGHVEVRAPIEQGLYAAGAVVTVSAPVKHNARLFGGSVEVTPAAHLGGSVSMAGRSLSMAGSVDGYLQMAGRDAVVTGTAGGDAEISAEHIEIGREARIGGKLRYRSGAEPVVAPGAVITGGVERLAPDAGRTPMGLQDGRFGQRATRAIHGVGRALWFSGSLLVGALLLLLAPGFLRDTSQIATVQWPKSIGLGFAILVTVPIVAVILLITLIGIPLGLLTLSLYAFVLLLGHVVGAVAVGDFALGRIAPSKAATTGYRVLCLLAALVALGLVRELPLIGGLAVLLVFVAGVGALTERVFHVTRREAAP